MFCGMILALVLVPLIGFYFGWSRADTALLLASALAVGLLLEVGEYLTEWIGRWRRRRKIAQLVRLSQEAGLYDDEGDGSVKRDSG